MTDLFRKKTIKCERRATADKKSKDYDIVGAKHQAKIDTFNRNALELPLLHKQIKRINRELKQLESQEGIDSMILDLTYKIEVLIEEKESCLLESDSENKKDESVKKKKAKKAKKSKKTKQILIKHGNEKELELEKIEEKITETEEKIHTLSRIFTRNSYSNDLKRKRSIIQEKIEEIESNDEEIDYFSRSIDLLCAYYDEPTIKDDDREVTIMELFDKQNNYMPDTSERKLLVDKYLLSINEQRRFKRPNLGKICEVCNVPKLLNNQESSFTCARCGRMDYVIMDPDKPSYNAGTEQKNNSYKRINHCAEKLNQSQGKESTDIDEQLMKDIMREIHVRNIKDLSEIDTAEVKSILKSIGKSNKSEHATHIAAKLNGVPIKTIPYHLIEIVKAMWKMIEEVWPSVKDPDRKNFMNSNFLFHKIFELLDEPEEAEKWPYLADEKLKEYDVKWEKVCNIYNWDFIRSI